MNGRVALRMVEFGIIGVILVKVFWFSALENLGWDMFWNGYLSCEVVNTSSGFLKCVLGFIEGAVVGCYVNSKLS